MVKQKCPKYAKKMGISVPEGDFTLFAFTY